MNIYGGLPGRGDQREMRGKRKVIEGSKYITHVYMKTAFRNPPKTV
jgi:hypothetical protein